MLPYSRFALRLRLVALVGAAVLPLLALLAWALPPDVVAVESDLLPRDWGIAVALVVSLLLAGALAALAGMLARIGRGELFTSAVTLRFRRFGRYLLLAALAELLLPLLIQAGLVAFGGRRMLRLGIDDGQFVTLVVALLLFLVARLFDEAARFEEDSRSII